MDKYASQLEELRRIPTPNVADALYQLGIESSTVAGLRPLDPRQDRYVGPAYTVTQRQKSDPVGPGKTRHQKVIDELASPGDVIVIDVEGRADVCTLGALLARRGQVRGLAGFLVNGVVRDALEITDVGFPVHSLGVSPRKSSEALETVALGETVWFGECEIAAGDIICADDSGAVRIPRGMLDATVERAQQIFRLETEAAVRIDAGMTVFDAFNGHY